MIAAAGPRAVREEARLLVVGTDAAGFRDARLRDLPALLDPGDLVVLNDAATLPASLQGETGRGEPVELRLFRPLFDGLWQAVLFGSGDWRTPTELRDPPARVAPGETLRLGDGFGAEVVDVSRVSDRLVTLRFNRSGPALWSAIYGRGRPIQYAYLERRADLWSVQTPYASRPWALEMPSAGWSLSFSVLLALIRRGVKLAALTHAAGISATGDEDLDDRLPMTESFEIPEATCGAVERARSAGKRVLAVGTTVVRALEGCAAENGGRIAAGTGETSLVIGRSFRPAIVDGLLTGVHDPAASHFRLLRAFAEERTLRRAWRHAAETGYLCHEFGDLALVMKTGAVDSAPAGEDRASTSAKTHLLSPRAVD